MTTENDRGRPNGPDESSGPNRPGRPQGGLPILRRRLSRRAVLRGAGGAVLGLPLLDAMVPALAQPGEIAPALRFGAIYVPNGIRAEVFRPPAGPQLELPPLLAPLDAVRRYTNVISGLSAPPQSEHHSATSLWLHGGSLHKTEGPDVRAGRTIDQHIAAAIGRETALPSLELGIEDMSGSPGACAYGYSCVYMNTLSWRTATAPLPMELNPQTVFERLFGDSGTPEQRAARRAQRASLLDSVLDSARSMRARLGASDRGTMNDYLDNLREVERRIELAAAGQSGQAGDLPAAPSGIPRDYESHVRLLYDLVVLALRTDTTRVFTFMKGVEASAINFPQIGVAESHHIVSHHQNTPAQLEKYTKINAYQVELFAEFVRSLAATPDGDGSLLDHSLLLYGSAMSNGNVHDRTRLPMLTVGAAAGRVRGGRHIEVAAQTPLANLIVGLGEAAGLDLEGLERSTGRVALI